MSVRSSAIHRESMTSGIPVSCESLMSMPNARSAGMPNRSIIMPLAWPMMSRFNTAECSFSSSRPAAIAMAACAANASPTAIDSPPKTFGDVANRFKAPAVLAEVYSWNDRMLRTPASSASGVNRGHGSPHEIVAEGGEGTHCGIDARSFPEPLLRTVEFDGQQRRRGMGFERVLPADEQDVRALDAGNQVDRRAGDRAQYTLEVALPGQRSRQCCQRVHQVVVDRLCHESALFRIDHDVAYEAKKCPGQVPVTSTLPLIRAQRPVALRVLRNPERTCLVRCERSPSWFRELGQAEGSPPSWAGPASTILDATSASAILLSWDSLRSSSKARTESTPNRSMIMPLA